MADFNQPQVKEYFARVKETLSRKRTLPKVGTAKGLNYSLNQEEHLKVFLTDGEVLIDDSASECALSNFTIRRKNRVTVNTVRRGGQASAVIYSVTETVRANDLNVCYYIRHLLTELPQMLQPREKLDEPLLEQLMPWSKTLPEECYSKRRR